MSWSKWPYKYWKTEGFFTCLYSSVVYTKNIVLVYFNTLMSHLKKKMYLSVLEILFRNKLFCVLDWNSSSINLIVEWKPNAQKASKNELNQSLY